MIFSLCPALLTRVRGSPTRGVGHVQFLQTGLKNRQKLLRPGFAVVYRIMTLTFVIHTRLLRQTWVSPGSLVGEAWSKLAQADGFYSARYRAMHRDRHAMPELTASFNQNLNQLRARELRS